MKVISYTALHYGKEYLYWAIRSVIDHVDEHHVLYSAVGSHGHRTDRVCPDTRDELYAEAARAAGDKLRWHDGEWPYEGAQRDNIYQYAPDADVILVVDADEVWHPDLVPYALEAYLLAPVRNVRVPMIHYWRSFYRAVIHDPAYPVRIIFSATQDGEATLSAVTSFVDSRRAVINHFGYAQRPAIVEYKLLTHGHRNEFRRDCNWFVDKFMANSQEDCHPVGSEYWWPEQVNPLDYLPEWMNAHPYFSMEVIPSC
jgi:hypothetical protein